MWIACSFHAAWGQDFAAKFMEQCTAEEEKDIQCQTISPKMMEKLVEVIVSEKDEKDEEIPAYLFSKLKSARIVTSTGHGKRYFRKAEELMEKNKNYNAIQKGRSLKT